MNWHLATFTKPIIGAINGIAYGAGAQLTTMLDIRIGCENTEIQFLAAKYGRANSTWSLPLVVGMPKAKELLYTGRPIKRRRSRTHRPAQSSRALRATARRLDRHGQTDRRKRSAHGAGHQDSCSTTASALAWRERFDAEQNAERTNSKPTRRAKASKHFSSARESVKMSVICRMFASVRHPGSGISSSPGFRRKAGMTDYAGGRIEVISNEVRYDRPLRRTRI